VRPTDDARPVKLAQGLTLTLGPPLTLEARLALAKPQPVPVGSLVDFQRIGAEFPLRSSILTSTPKGLTTRTASGFSVLGD
jgi:hypothetical protein